MSEATIIITGQDEGLNNADLEAATERLRTGKQYKDMSTLCVIPTRGVISARVVESYMGLQSPMNNRFHRMFVSGMEVGEAYNQAVELLLHHDMLKDFKYLLTMEEDNLPPYDGLLKLMENICDCKRACREHFAQLAGLYWTKGHGTGQPMIYGNPHGLLTFEPQVVQPGTIQECNGTGMGFTLFHTGIFRDKKFKETSTPEGSNKPVWFKTVQGEGSASMGTQDLYMMSNLRRAGFRIGSDNRVRVGHYDQGTETVF